MKKNYELPSDEIQGYLKAVVDFFDKEDRAVRDRQIRVWRRMKLYWDGFQKVWFNEIAHDWRVYEDFQVGDNQNNEYYDKPVNVFRAYLETIIAALSVIVPPLRCTPDDADNPLDKQTAKAGNKIITLIYKQNHAIFLWVHALWIYCTEGLVFAFTYPDTHKKYGTYKKEHYKDFEEDRYNCPECDESVDELFSDGVTFEEEIDITCPACGNIIPEELEPRKSVVTRMTGTTDEPKTRQRIDIRGGLYVKVPNYTSEPEENPYLFYSYETNYVNIMEEYDHLEEFKNWTNTGLGGPYDPYERWGRLNPQYHGEYPINTVTKRQCWLRPQAFNCLPEDQRKVLKDKYPKGAKVTLANEEFCDAREECMDDHWTLTKNPLSDYLHHDPLGLLLTSIQDITNELVSLTLQTIEHGIPQTFADPSVLNFNEYSQTEVSPGTIYPVRPNSGKSVGEAFYEIKTSNLSREVMPFGQKIQEMGQLVVGALPSLFGGAAKTGSNTAAEYSMSRAQALQRLQTPWKMFIIFWQEIFGKVIPAYLEMVEEDEQFVTQDKNGNDINVFIRKAELQGKIGSVEIEANENLPMSHTQKKDTYMELLGLNTPEILQALSSPENLPVLKEAIGLEDFVIPGEADRDKQYEEIELLIASSPMPEFVDGGLNAETGEPEEIEIEVPSIPIDPLIDDNSIQAEICRVWALSEAGQLCKTENPEGYKNVLLHMKMHKQAEMLEMQAAMPPPAAGGNIGPANAAQQGVQ